MVENANPSLEIQPKMQPHSFEIGIGVDRKCNPFVRNKEGNDFRWCRKSNPSTRNGIKNATPQAQMQRRHAKHHTPSHEMASQTQIITEKNMSRPHETNKCLGNQACCGSPWRRKLAKSRTRRVFLLRPRPPATCERCGGASSWQCGHGKRRDQSTPDGHARLGPATI